jgi:hypothetical protein
MKEITNCLNTIDQQITIFLRIKRNELRIVYNIMGVTFNNQIFIVRCLRKLCFNSL